MFQDSSPIDEVARLWESSIDNLDIFLNSAPVQEEDLLLPVETTIDCMQEQSVYRVKEGVIKEYYKGNAIINYEPGDLVGFDSLYVNKETQLKTDFAVLVDRYDANLLMEYVRSDARRFSAWNEFLMNMIQAYQLLVCHSNSEESGFHPDIRTYKSGETIIEEGSSSDEVFTLATGTAKVYVKDKQVGEVHNNEIFGAVATLTNSPRTATVIADTDCTVLVVESDQFMQLITSRPETVVKLLEDMARALISSNERIIQQN